MLLCIELTVKTNPFFFISHRLRIGEMEILPLGLLLS